MIYFMRYTTLALIAIIFAGCDESPSNARDGSTAGDTNVTSDNGSQPHPDGASPSDFGGNADGSIQPDQTSNDSSPPPPPPPPGSLAEKYPGDDGIQNDPAVVFVENFEAASVGDIVSRYEDHKNQVAMALVSDVPAKSGGSKSLRLTAGPDGTGEATDFYKKFSPGYEELFVRYYAKYESGVNWHHTGVWIGGYNPAQNWPSPKAGTKPDGDDRFSISIEPMGSGSNPGPRMDFYNYWMKMHASTAYWGNTLIHQQSFTVDNDQWMCIEIQVKLNPNPSSGAGGELAVWKNDTLIVHFTDQAPLGYWLKDKFCPEAADGTECTNYPPAPGTQMIPLDLQYRNTSALRLNYLWPQNYITDGNAGDVYYDDIVVATSRVGCLR